MNKIKPPKNNNRKRPIFTIAMFKYVRDLGDACEQPDTLSAGAGVKQKSVYTLA